MVVDTEDKTLEDKNLEDKTLVTHAGKAKAKAKTNIDPEAVVFAVNQLPLWFCAMPGEEKVSGDHSCCQLIAC